MSVPNYPSVCSCASPECLENGCVLRRRYSQAVLCPAVTKCPQLPSSAPPMPLTADDVRRIVREELARAAEQSNERREG